MRRNDQVCDKREIIDNVWEFDFDGDDNIVEVYIRYLRRKIDVPFERRAIQTVRHLGYRLSADGG
jgi:two-component system OmpR family response regulator